MKKRWLGIVLTICMVLTLLPTAAWAEGETGTVAEVGSEADLKAAIETGTALTVKLTAEIELSESLTVNRSVTLDLNDHVLTITGENQFITVSGEGTNMTLKDSAEAKTERKFSINQDGAWVLDKNGDQTVSGGVITGGKAGVDKVYDFLVVDGGVCIKERGTLTVTGVTVNAPVKIDNRGTIAGSGIFNSTVINEERITGGTFYGPVANYLGRDRIINEISGGTFYGTVANGYNYTNTGTGEGEVPADNKSEGLITNGTFYGKVTNAFHGKITGGSFYGEVDNRDRSEYRTDYQGTLAGGTFYGEVKNYSPSEGYCTVTYEYPFDEPYAIQIVKAGEKAIQPADPERSDCTFNGWYTYEGAVYDFATTVTDALTLYGLSTDTNYGIRITDTEGEVYYVTNKNYTDVLGDGTVVYTPGYADADKTFTNGDWVRALRGETVEGLQLPKLTLSGANLQSILMTGIRGSDANTLLLSTMLQIELAGENTVSCTGDGVDAIYARMLIITGTGSLNATATGQNAAAIAVDSEGGRYYQYGGDVTLYGAYGGICCSEAYFEFADGKLTVSSPRSALYCDLDNLHFKITSDTTTFFCGASKEEAFEIQQPSVFENIVNRLGEENCHYVPIPGCQTILYAQLISNHTVTFDMDGGSTVDPQTVAYGKTAQEPAAPTKSGYTFDGWYLADGTKYDFSTPVTADLTLTAHWTRNSSGGGSGGTTTYTLTFDTNGGSALSALRLARGSTVDLAQYVPERSGHVFTGWYADAALTQPIKNVTLTASTTVYAGWRAETNDLPFADVGADAWYRDDVQYVYDKGLMTGMTADRFAPNEGMTRAMLVTVLWRQAGSPVVNYAMDFSDVAEGAWYAEAVRWAASEGVVGGYGDGRFGPNDPITREQLATILFRHLVGDGAAELADWLRPYADADQISGYAAPAMQWAVGHGVLKGDGDQLDPQGTATRAQVAAMLHRALEL